LRTAAGIFVIGPLGRRGGFTYAVDHGDSIMIKCGCWWGDLDTFAARVRETHGDNEHGRAYAAAIEYIKAYVAVYWRHS
jgi:hypothetical protein